MARRDRGRARTGALAASVLVHLALFVVLARVAAPTLREPVEPPERDFQVQLVNEPTTAAPMSAPRASRQAAARSALTASATRPVEARTARASAAPSPPPPTPPARAVSATRRPPPPQAPKAAPAPPSPMTASIPAAGARSGSATGAGPPSGGGHWAVQPGDEGQDGVRTFLRATVGCSHEDFARLTTQERAACDRRVGHDARMIGDARVDTVGGAKRGYYAAVQDAYHSLHDARPEYDAQGNRIVPGRGPALGCKFGVEGVKCGVKAPQGVGTEESGIPPP